MVTHAEAKIHRVGPRHTIYLAKDLVEDSTFPFRTDEDLTVRIEGDALIIDKDGRSGRRPTKLDEAHSHRDMVLSEFFDPGATGKAPKGLFSVKPSALESVNNLVQKDLSGLDKPEVVKKIRGWMAEVHASNETNLPTRIAVEDYSWFLQNGLDKGLMELEQSIGRRVKENMTILCGYNVSKLNDPKHLETLIGFHGYAILDQPFRAYRRSGPLKSL